MKKYFVLLFAVLLTISFSCRKDEVSDPENVQENKDFYEFMQDWYYWNNTIPAIKPANYTSVYEVLEAIRYKPLDRWSYIYDWTEFLAYFMESRLIGYGFGSAWDSSGKLRVAFIHNTTEMYESGVRRSWIIDKINGVNINSGMNISQMLGVNQIGVSNTFSFIKPDNTTVEMTLQKKEVFANTVLHHQIFEYPGLKVGYLVLQSFRDPTEAELNSVFLEFSAAGIDELILDMRYNGGGLVSIATKLASLIAGPSYANQPFVKFEYNANKADERNATVNLENIENSLGLNRLITICTRGSASASELMINGLRPYFDVIIVGNTTYGKPMGSNIFNYGDKYAFAPITFKTKNADDEGDYFDGIPVDVPAPDDLSRNFGDPEEGSLQIALAYILSGISKSIQVSEPEIRQPWEDMTGLRWESRMH
jgi:carboxyl-terminal processing protease